MIFALTAIFKQIKTTVIMVKNCLKNTVLAMRFAVIITSDSKPK